MSNDDLGFTYKENNDEIKIFHHGRKITVLRGIKAIKFKKKIEISEFSTKQLMMARLTGNYKRGNERVAKNHRRNRL